MILSLNLLQFVKKYLYIKFYKQIEVLEGSKI